MTSQDHSRIAIIIGTRAELIKTFPVMRELQKRNIPYYFIHTGQKGLEGLYKEFGVKRPDVVLTDEPKGEHKFGGNNPLKGIYWNLGIVLKIKRALAKLPNLKYVIYHGDTMTTTSAALGSSRVLNPLKKFKNVHLEAGLRSFDIFEPFPEEISRRVAGMFSDILFAPSEKSHYNLRFKRKEIHLTGNTIVDAAHFALEQAKKKKYKPLSRKKFALITVHRHENIRSRKRMKRIVDILCSLEIPAYFALHENTKIRLQKYGLLDKLKKNGYVHLIKPRNYSDFVYQISKCSLIICDGGSMQEESLLFHKPCVVLRMKTERPEGLQTNFQFLSKLDVAQTKKKIKEFLSPQFKVKKVKNPYGKKGLTKRIVDVLVK